MHRTRLLVAFIACLSLGGTRSLLRGQAQNPSIELQLRSQYRVSSVDGNGKVVRVGAVLVVAQDGLKANPPSPAGCWYNSHKPGDRIKYSKLFEATVPADVRNQVRLLQVGERLVVLKMDIRSSEVGFCVQTYSDNPNDAPYRAAVAFQFSQKNYVQVANLKAIQDSIAEIFSPDNASPTERSVPALGDRRDGTKTGESGLSASVVGLWVRPTGRQLQLSPDGSFSEHGPNPNSTTASGHFTVDGNALVLNLSDGRSSTWSIHEDGLYSVTGVRSFVRQGDSTTPTIAPLRLPATYVSAQTPTDQLQLNPDNSFSLQEAGQTYRGTFAANGNTLEINISDGPKTTMTIHGSNLTDPSGQTWALREQPVQPGSSVGVLQNQDIINLAKAGIDDAIILAKIGSSKCQFDTSTDALIQLKSSGVSAAVLKAMVGAGK